MALMRASGKAKYFLLEGWTSGFEGREVICRHGQVSRVAKPPLTLPNERGTIRGMRFEILGEISDIETFATGSGIREIARLRRIYGRGRWRKRKGIVRVRLADGTIHLAELHWYEATGIGRKEFKIKHLL